MNYFSAMEFNASCSSMHDIIRVAMSRGISKFTALEFDSFGNYLRKRFCDVRSYFN